MLFIIDGYNLLFQSRCDPSLSLEEQRESLLRDLALLARSSKNAICIVFDAANHEELRKTYKEEIEIIYSPQGLSADDYIIELFESKAHPRQITVVTSDSHLIRCVKEKGGRTEKVDVFLQRCSRTKKRGQIPSFIREDFKDIPFSQAEFQRWLRIFEQGLDEEE